MSKHNNVTNQEKIFSAIKRNPFFSSLSRSVLKNLIDKFELISVKGGDVIIEEGSDEKELYLVVHGRLRVFRTYQINHEIFSEYELGKNEIFGEISLLVQRKRSASVVAIRDSDLLRLSKDAFEELLVNHPEAGLKLAKLSIGRLLEAQNNEHNKLFSNRFIAFCLIPSNNSTLFDKIIMLMLSEMKKQKKSVFFVDKNTVEQLMGSSIETIYKSDVKVNQLTRLLNEKELLYDFVIYQSDPVLSHWTQLCLRQSDAVYLLHDVSASEINTHISEYINDCAHLKNHRISLVLIHENQQSQTVRASEYLSELKLEDVYHVMKGRTEDFARLMRIITGQSLGVVLGGGGARGFAHIGLVKALYELNVDIDIIGGTSLGALVAMSVSAGYSVDDMITLCRDLLIDATTYDYTLPYMSLMSGKKLNQVLRSIYGENKHIEDLWIRSFCVSTNISNCDLVVHQTGLIWESVRASLSLPGIYPPVVRNNELLVDGGVVNNLPVNIMGKHFHAGKILASNISVTHEAMNYNTSVDDTGWDLFRSTLNPFNKNKKYYPRVGDVLRRSLSVNQVRNQSLMYDSVDYFVDLNMSGFRTHDFGRFDEIIAIGYEQAMKKLLKLKL